MGLKVPQGVLVQVTLCVLFLYLRMGYLGDMDSKVEMRFSIVAVPQVGCHCIPGTPMAANGICARST